jgi:hypothetical protein
MAAITLDFPPAGAPSSVTLLTLVGSDGSTPAITGGGAFTGPASESDGQRWTYTFSGTAATYTWIATAVLNGVTSPPFSSTTPGDSSSTVNLSTLPASPFGGVATGDFAPVSTGYAQVVAGSGLTLLARVLGTDGMPIATSAVSTIGVVVTNVPDDVITLTGQPTVAATVSPTLQIDPRWNEDAVGFNITLPLPPWAFPTGDRTYRVDATITATAGAVAKVLWNVQCSLG